MDEGVDGIGLGFMVLGGLCDGYMRLHYII